MSMNSKNQNQIEHLSESGFEEVQALHLLREDLIIRVHPNPDDCDASVEEEKHQVFYRMGNSTREINVCGEISGEIRPSQPFYHRESLFDAKMAHIVRVFLKRDATTWKDIRILYRRGSHSFFVALRTDQPVTYQEMTAVS